MFPILSYMDKNAQTMVKHNPRIENLLEKTAQVVIPKRKPVIAQKVNNDVEVKKMNNAIEYAVYNMKSRIDRVVSNSREKKQILCVAKNIYYESRGENQLGRAAVAMVTMNRSKRANIPPCDVVYQKNDRGCQFSWVCQLKTSKDLQIHDANAWKESMVIAYLSVKEALDDFSNGATHYFNPSVVRPKWEKDFEPINNDYMKDGILGSHKFLLATNYYQP